MFSDRKPKFRSRKLDNHKALPVYRHDEIEDLDDYDSPLRAIAQVATGVDKEEEEEHHLRQALNHQSTKAQAYYIPTPETSKLVSDYGQFYPANYKQPKCYVKTLATEDPLLKFPRYNANHDDEVFLKGLRDSGGLDLALFEWIIDYLEDIAHRYSETVVKNESIERLRDRFGKNLPHESTTNAIIEYWQRRRLQRPLISHLKHEDLGKLGADPYVCFRRRELKLPRKTRRSDAQIVDRLKKFHLDLSTTKILLQAAIKRDRYKREALLLEGDLFDKYQLIDNWRIHNKSSWPSHIPNFKAAAQSLLEPKKKKVRLTEVDMDTAAVAAYKIAIPVSVLRGSRHARPYYPHEIGKQIQRDLEAILGHGQDATLQPLNQTQTSQQQQQQRKRQHTLVEDICPIPKVPSGQMYTSAAWLNGRLASSRLSRCNRLVVDTMPMRPTEFRLRPNDHSEPTRTKFLASILPAKEFTQLQTPVGNYNVFAVQTANQIMRPMSFPAWIAATAPLMAAFSGGGGSGSSGGSRQKSPKKKRPKTSTEESKANQDDNSKQLGEASTSPTATTANGSEMSKLSSPGTANKGQITVKVKSQPSKEARKGTNARFTPHGLTPESVNVK